MLGCGPLERRPASVGRRRHPRDQRPDGFGFRCIGAQVGEPFLLGLNPRHILVARVEIHRFHDPSISTQCRQPFGRFVIAEVRIIETICLSLGNVNFPGFYILYDIGIANSGLLTMNRRQTI